MRGRLWVCLLMVLLGLPVHAASRSQLEYFPLELQKAAIECQWGQHRVKLPLLSDFEDKWFSEQLSRAEEPSLFAQSLKPPPDIAASYRFIWLRSFHAPIMIRIDKRRHGAMALTAKRLSGRGGYDPGHLDATIRRPLTRQESENMRRLFVGNALVKFQPNPCDRGTDGAQWLVESQVGGQYHVVNQFSPQTGPVRRIGLALLSLTNWKIGPVY